MTESGTWRAERTPVVMPRRRWLALASAAATGVFTPLRSRAQEVKRPKVAAIFTELRLRSHAYHFLSNLMGPYLFRGQWLDPGVDVVSWYCDQFPQGDMAREGSARLKVPIYKSIDEALCLGGRELAVD